ncbi:M48 family metalloprotease [Sphingorhabdus sp. 109]|jgi:predicted Zn-dependent protease|uniref:M48 family metalloprotease n=1 Tax=Sphingorhabdus sp. 109 TaxID=2653173 RepID=UPI0012F43B03|nr:M48 family metalloprotease [Sphingorhabdus sp. 109]VWX58516.1 Peptidase M48 Ste24p [Sphingorhabdus sp. 109]
MRQITTKLMSAAGVIALVACTGSGADAGAVNSAGSQAGEARSISEAEKQKGAEAHPQLLEEFGGAYSGPQVGYVVGVGQNIAVQSGLGNARSDFTVTLLNSPVNNAFAIPGGYVYLTRQLMALMNDEAEMAGVLGHEVGHVAARHSEKRQKAATRNSILGILGQIGSQVLLGDSSLGRIGQEIFGTGSQLLTLKYSRKQEYEADDLGIRYLASAGYDPQALSTMLYSLAAQSAIDARVAGRDARSTPEWASTHPDPARRVSRAASNANKLAQSGGVRNRDRFLQNLDGILYGDDPKQGVIEGSSFLHRDLKLKFTVPNGFSMQNGARAVSISGSGGQGQFTTGVYSGNMATYIDAAFKGLAGEGQSISYGDIQRTTVNGLPAAYAMARVDSSNGKVDVTVFAYEFSKSSAFHFATIAPAGSASVFSPMYQSINRLSASEAAAIRSRKVDIVTVQSGDTISNLSTRMAYDNYQLDRFLVLNRMDANDGLRVGQKVKIITY